MCYWLTIAFLLSVPAVDPNADQKNAEDAENAEARKS